MEKQFYERNKDPNFWTGENVKCNCGSFALNVTSWFSPYDNDDKYSEEDRTKIIRSLYEEGYSREDIMDIVLRRDQEEILRVCPWIEPVLPNEILPTDRVIAYRININFNDWDSYSSYIDEDFHFRVRIGGFWFEKCGEDKVQFCNDQNVSNQWYSAANLSYDSEILFFRFVTEI